MPPDPQHAHCLVSEYLLHLALWQQRGIPGRDEYLEGVKHSKLWLQHGCVAGFGIAAEQLALSSDL
eukprot:343779-Amphidinium_carterae.1